MGRMTWINERPMTSLPTHRPSGPPPPPPPTPRRCGCNPAGPMAPCEWCHAAVRQLLPAARGWVSGPYSGTHSTGPGVGSRPTGPALDVIPRRPVGPPLIDVREPGLLDWRPADSPPLTPFWVRATLRHGWPGWLLIAYAVASCT